MSGLTLWHAKAWQYLRKSHSHSNYCRNRASSNDIALTTDIEFIPFYRADTVAQKPDTAALLMLFVQNDRMTRLLSDGVIKTVGQKKRDHLLNSLETPIITHILFFAIWTIQTMAVFKIR